MVLLGGMLVNAARRRSVSLHQAPLLTLPCFKLSNGGQKPLGILGAAQQIGRFFKRLVVLQGHHDHGLRAQLASGVS